MEGSYPCRLLRWSLLHLTFLGRGDLVSTTAWRPGIAISMTKGRQATLPHLLIPISFQQLSSNVDQVTHSISELKKFCPLHFWLKQKGIAMKVNVGHSDNVLLRMFTQNPIWWFLGQGS